jgi:hypothetical protein
MWVTLQSCVARNALLRPPSSCITPRASLDLKCARVQILEELLGEYDQSPHTWHLLALAQYGGGCYEEAMTALERGRKLLAAAEQLPDADTKVMFDDLDARIREGLSEDAADP